MTPTPDLIKALAAGDPKAQEELFLQYRDKVYNTILSLVQQVEDAEELTQDVFLEVFRSAGSFRGQSSISTWIYRISTNKALDHLKYLKRKKRFAFFSNLFHPESQEPVSQAVDFHHPGIRLEKKEEASILFMAIRQLPEKQQSAFVLFEMEGLSYAQIAEVLQSSVPAIESLMHRARENLRKELGHMYQNKNSGKAKVSKKEVVKNNTRTV